VLESGGTRRHGVPNWKKEGVRGRKRKYGRVGTKLIHPPAVRRSNRGGKRHRIKREMVNYEGEQPVWENPAARSGRGRRKQGRDLEEREISRGTGAARQRIRKQHVSQSRGIRNERTWGTRNDEKGVKDWNITKPPEVLSGNHRERKREQGKKAQEKGHQSKEGKRPGGKKKKCASALSVPERRSDLSEGRSGRIKKRIDTKGKDWSPASSKRNICPSFIKSHSENPANKEKSRMTCGEENLRRRWFKGPTLTSNE